MAGAMSLRSIFPCVLFIPALAFLPLQPLHAQTVPRSALEEIVVTARQRQENLSEVPVSIQVMDGNTLENNNIRRLADITEFVPNLSMTETGISTRLYIRGIGSGNNQGFEQSVGQYVDGIHYGRQQQLRVPFFDLARLEVLRGPQGVLFGKNTIAGAISLTTARASELTEFRLQALHEITARQSEVEGLVSGPLNDEFRARLAFRSALEDGYLENNLHGRREPARDENAVRLSLDWDISPVFGAWLKLEHNSFGARGRQTELVRDDPALEGVFAGLNLASILTTLDEPATEANQDFRRQANAVEFSDNDLNNITFHLDYDRGSGPTLTLISAYVGYDSRERCDCDYTPASIFEVALHERYQQFSQEVRLLSPNNTDFRWLLGGYYQNNSMRSQEAFDIPVDSLLNKLAVMTPARAALGNLAGTSALRNNHQQGDAWAVFAQGSQTLSRNWHLTLGARYTLEHKAARRRIDVLDTASQNIIATPEIPMTYLGAFGLHSQQLAGLPSGPESTLPGHELSGSRTEASLAPSLTLEWDTSDNSMLYGSVSRGFKAGGFDARANNPFSFEFGKETSRTYELGSKSMFAGGSLELNSAIFHTDYRDLQVSQFDGNLGFNVGNARKTAVQGLELNGRWAAAEEMIIGYAYAWLDFRYRDFSNGNCHNRQLPDGDVVNGVQLCDFSGRRGQYTPEHSLSLFLDHYRQLSGMLGLSSKLSINHVSAQNIHDNLDPAFRISSVSRINLRLGLHGNNWEVALLGRNLLGKKVLSHAGNVPISASLFGTNTYYAFVDKQRQYAAQASYHF